MPEIENKTVTDKMIQIKNLIIEQLTHSKDFNMEYKLCLDFLKNYKEGKYKEMMVSRTKKTAVELHKYASGLVSSVGSYIYRKLITMTEEEQSRLLQDEKYMVSFIQGIDKFIRSDNNDILLFSAKRD